MESTALVRTFTDGEGKLVAYLTFEQIRPALGALGLIDESEMRAISREFATAGWRRNLDDEPGRHRSGIGTDSYSVRAVPVCSPTGP